MREIELAVNKDYAIPMSVEDYEFLASHSIYSTKLNRSFLPSLSDLLKCKFKLVELSTLFDSAYSKTEHFWTSKATGTANFEKKSSNQIYINGSLNDENKELIKKIEQAWRKFFNRWGYTSAFEYSETLTKCKLVITYEDNSYPEIEVSKEVKLEKLDQSMILGHLKFQLVIFDNKKMIQIVDTNVNKPIATCSSKCIDSGLISALVGMHMDTQAVIKS